MITIDKDYHIEYSEEFNNALSDFAILVGDSIKSMEALEKFYALKMVSEEIESRVTLYTVMGTLVTQNASKE